MTDCARLEISAATMLPDLLLRHPEARAVFDRYGLKGCGGPLGPHESIAFFSRTHGVEEKRLLREIREAIGLTASARPGAAAGVEDFAPSVADTIYRRFFLAGILTVLTAGAGWGVWLLWSIGIAGNFTAVSISEVNAHGHAQIFGWVGLFIMGFGYQAFPRLWHTSLAAPRLAVAAFAAMLAGMTLRVAGMAAPEAAWAGPATLLGGGLELAAVATFAGQIAVTFRRSGARLEPYVGFVLTALLWFFAQTALGLWHTMRILGAATQEELLWQVATWQAPLRDLQIHGMALFMIAGVSLRMLPALFDLPKIRERRAWAALAVLTLSVAGEIGLFLAYRYTDAHVIAAFLLLPWIGLAVGAALIALPWRLWRPLRAVDGLAERSAKFIRAAWGWLAVSLAMLLLLPVYQAVSGIAFSHAYYGAIRHAITVGFISLMIMGFAAKVVPTLAGVDPARLPSLWTPFWLVNAGCFLRVTMQTMTDWHPAFFPLIGASGVLEISGLAIWGTGLVRIMLQARREERIGLAPELGAAPERLEIRHTVAQALGWFPATEAVFEKHGFTPLRNPVLRRTLARRVTLAHAAAIKGIDPEHLAQELNDARFSA